MVVAFDPTVVASVAEESVAGFETSATLIAEVGAVSNVASAIASAGRLVCFGSVVVVEDGPELEHPVAMTTMASNAATARDLVIVMAARIPRLARRR